MQLSFSSPSITKQTFYTHTPKTNKEMKEENSTELIPGLPEELALEILTRLHYTSHGFGSRVSRRWRRLLQSKDFYNHRQQSGQTRKTACLVQCLPTQPDPNNSKSVPKHPTYCISIFDPVSGIWDRVDPIPKYPDGLPLFCQVTGSDGNLVVMGGWDPVSWDPIRDVFVYEFTTRKWTKRRDMPGIRSFFAAGGFSGRVFIAGGHDDCKNALKSCWVYDLGLDEWAEFSPMSEERDECEGVFIGSEFRVVSGYGTESQGRFKSSVEVFDVGSGQWTRVENGWNVSECPRSCAGVGTNGELICWAKSDPGVRVGSCGIDLGGRSLVTGSAYQGGQQEFFMVEGQKGKFVKIDVPSEYQGFVQSGCCVEI